MPGQGEKGTDPRLYGIMIGQVVFRNDPSGLGRIRWMVPGMVEPFSGWALPIGMAAQKEDGVWNIPASGENVACGFLGGDSTKPFWIPGPWADDEAPFDDVEKKGLRFFDFHMQMQEDELVIEDTRTPMSIKLDRTRQKITIAAPGGVDVESLGPVHITGGEVTLMGRTVIPNGAPIK